MVVGVLQRGGAVRTAVVESRKKKPLQTLVKYQSTANQSPQILSDFGYGRQACGIAPTLPRPER
jgi:hypothetical protein